MTLFLRRLLFLNDSPTPMNHLNSCRTITIVITQDGADYQCVIKWCSVSKSQQSTKGWTRTAAGSREQVQWSIKDTQEEFTWQRDATWWELSGAGISKNIKICCRKWMCIAAVLHCCSGSQTRLSQRSPEELETENEANWSHCTPRASWSCWVRISSGLTTTAISTTVPVITDGLGLRGFWGEEEIKWKHSSVSR